MKNNKNRYNKKENYVKQKKAKFNSSSESNAKTKKKDFSNEANELKKLQDIILKKENCEELTEKELEFALKGYTNNLFSDDQFEPFVRSIYKKGMTEEETYILTMLMARSGKIFSWKEDFVIDKHSTGGVGDKVTLVLMPILRALGFKVAKISGRSLGLTGGTADKLESIRNLKIDLSEKEFVDAVNKLGICIMTQTNSIVPADKKIYNLRDERGLTDSIPLIASSVMCKKIAIGAKNLILEVTYGTGAFMKTKEEALELARYMKSIGAKAGINTLVITTSMNEPLGYTVGNRLEVVEAFKVLSGEKSPVRDICIHMCLEFLKMFKNNLLKEENFKYLRDLKTDKDIEKYIEKQIDSKNALNIFVEMLKNQGADENDLYKLINGEDEYSIKEYGEKIEILAKEKGQIVKLNAIDVAKAAFSLGAGKNKPEDVIDYLAGVKFLKIKEDHVEKNEVIAEMYFSKELEKKKIKEAIIHLDNAIGIK